jgi:crotonobetainyl-CoA:carnitine CoA-transferase CaiB-like acyl-CoA transferase
MKPLDGIRVLDIATLVAGPYAAASLAEFGADVIKIEKPGTGDTLRQLGTKCPTGDTYWWLSDARNKRSVELDLRTPDGVATFKKMVKTADIVVENFRPGTLAKWGLDFAQLHRINPRLILLSVTGYGQTGPDAHRPGLARIAEGFAGFTHLTGTDQTPPLLSGASALADYISGTFGAYGLMLALRARDQTGQGQQVDVALYEGILRYLDELIPAHDQTGDVRGPMGSETHRSVPHASYQCADGDWVGIACTNDTLFARLTTAMNRADMLETPRFATNAARIAHRAEVNGIVTDWTRSHPRASVIAACTQANVPCGPINDIAATMAEPQIVHRKSIEWVSHPTLGRVAVPGVFPKLSDTPGEITHLGPELGADNALLHISDDPTEKDQTHV